MNNPFVVIDSWLIDRIFQPISWASEARTGWNNFQIARVIAVLAVAYSVVDLVNSGDYIGGLMRGLLSMAIVFISTIIERRTKPGLMNGLRSAWLYIRIFWILLAATTIVVGLFHVPANRLINPSISNQIFYTAWTACTYFFSCNKMPPGWKMPEKVSRAAETT